MAASTQDRYDIESGFAAQPEYPMKASVTIYKGTCVQVDTTGASQGRASMCTNTANTTFVGVASRQADNSGGIIDAMKVPIQPPQSLSILELDATSPDNTWIGQLLVFTDDHTVALTGSGAQCGRCIEVNGTGTSGRVTVDLLIKDES